MKPVLYSLLSNHHTTGTFFVFITLDATRDGKKRIKNDHRENARKDANCNISCEFFRDWIHSTRGLSKGEFKYLKNFI